MNGPIAGSEEGFIGWLGLIEVGDAIGLKGYQRTKVVAAIAPAGFYCESGMAYHSRYLFVRNEEVVEFRKFGGGRGRLSD